MMRILVLRARKAPVAARRFRAAVGADAHVEVIAHTLINALFYSRGHHDDVVIHVVLESSADYARTVAIDARELESTGGFHEAAMVHLVADALERSGALAKEELREVAPGVSVSAVGFERLVTRLAAEHPLYLLDRKGSDLRHTPIEADPCFILTDHLPMPRKSLNTLHRLNAQSVSVGPKVLFASQCIVLIHNELDRRGI